MVTRIEMTHSIHCPVDAFWSNFLDDELQRQIFMSDLRYHAYRVTERQEKGGSVKRRVEITPKLTLPGSLKKIIGTRFSYVEEGELRDGVYRFKILPPEGFESSRATSEGQMRVEASGEGRTRRIVDLTVDIRMLGLGAMLETFAIKAVEETYASHANAVNTHLAHDAA